MLSVSLTTLEVSCGTTNNIIALMAPTKTIIVTVIAKGLFALLTHDFLLFSKFLNNFLSKIS